MISIVLAGRSDAILGEKQLRVIGVTGGVGAGKSQILNFLEEEYGAYVLRTDELARNLMLPGTDLNRRLQALLAGRGGFDRDGKLLRGKLADLIFADPGLRARMNGLIHPAVKEEVMRQIRHKRAEARCSLFIIEAALLIEDGYERICDELWYIYADEEHRRSRLRESRHYRDEKISAIFASQLPEETFRRHCVHVIDNNGSPEEAYRQIRSILDHGTI